MAKRTMPVKKQKETEPVYKDVPVEEGNPIKLMVANCQILNLRDKPSKESRVLAKLPASTIVLIDEMDGEWLHVRSFGNELEMASNSQPGYILAEYTSEV